jgi:hypothetical protein
MQVRRKEIFGRDGKLDTDVQYQEYQGGVEGAVFPHVIDIKRPSDDYALKITFQKAAVNQPLEADSFVLPRPEGAELVQLDDAVAVQPN